MHRPAAEILRCAQDDIGGGLRARNGGGALGTAEGRSERRRGARNGGGALGTAEGRSERRRGARNDRGGSGGAQDDIRRASSVRTTRSPRESATSVRMRVPRTTLSWKARS